MNKGVLHGTHGQNVIKNNYLLDKFTGAAAAYSLRKLRNDYKGPCIRVRRTTDNTETDIYFRSDNFQKSPEYVDHDAAYIFGTTNLVIAKWYDQSGNGYDLTTTRYPLFSNSTTSNTGGRRFPFYNKGGFLGLAFNGLGCRLINSSITMTNPFSFFIVNSIAASSGLSAGIFFDSYNNVQCVCYNTGITEVPNNSYRIGAGSALNGNSINANVNLISGQFSNTDCVYDRNSSRMSIGTIGTNNLSGISVGDIRGNPNPVLATQYEFKGLFFELVLYPGKLNDKKYLIDNHIKKYYNIDSYHHDYHPFY